tara:strand:- start:1000 stop:1548 length:549 start_codon:yes stop_codon:yes gene_type:complete
MGLISEIKSFLVHLIINWPCTKLGYKMRESFYRRHLKSSGSNLSIASGVIFGDPVSIEIGNYCKFGRNVNIGAGECNGIYIGSYVSIADGTYFRSGNHKFDSTDIPIQHQGHYSSEIQFNNEKYSVVIEDDVWIGARAIILSGTHIGKGSIVGAGTVVSSKIPPYSIVMGNPGRVISKRKVK